MRRNHNNSALIRLPMVHHKVATVNKGGMVHRVHNSNGLMVRRVHLAMAHRKVATASKVVMVNKGPEAILLARCKVVLLAPAMAVRPWVVLLVPAMVRRVHPAWEWVVPLKVGSVRPVVARCLVPVVVRR